MQSSFDPALWSKSNDQSRPRLAGTMPKGNGTRHDNRIGEYSEGKCAEEAYVESAPDAENKRETIVVDILEIAVSVSFLK